MIRVTVELFPRGSVREGKILSQFFIINDGTGDRLWGNYQVSKKSKIKQIANFRRTRPVEALVALAADLLSKK
jgi:hypothetical protein